MYPSPVPPSSIAVAGGLTPAEADTWASPSHFNIGSMPSARRSKPPGVSAKLKGGLGSYCYEGGSVPQGRFREA